MIRRDCAGFSLIESMVALLILSVGCVAVLGLFVLTDRAVSTAAQWDRALGLARQIIEYKRGLPYERLELDDRDGDGSADGSMAPTAGGFVADDEAGRFHRRWVVRVDAPEAGLATVDVTVDWRDWRGRPHRLTLGLLRADPRREAAS